MVARELVVLTIRLHRMQVRAITQLRDVRKVARALGVELPRVTIKVRK